MAEFVWEDPLMLEDQLSEEERQIRDAARDFAQGELAPLIVDWNRREFFDPEIMKEFGKLGFLGATLPDYGCAGISNVSYGLIAREMERVDTCFRSAMGVQTGLVMAPIHMYGSDEQKEKYLPPLRDGEIIGCMGLTEPSHGSDAAGMQTRAKKVDGGYKLTGTKQWITNSPLAQVALVWAKNEEGEVGGYLLERGTQGLDMPKIEGKMAVRASSTGFIHMDEVFCPEENKLPGVTSMRGPLSALSNARFGICWGGMGAAEDCWTKTRDYVIDRIQFGRPLAANQLIQKKLVEMQTEIALGLQSCLRISRLRDENRVTPEMISLVKRNSTGKALEIARHCRDMHGANGVSDEYHVIRHMVNMEVINTLEGTHDIHTLILGRAMTGIAAFN
jgi:glutaryl-CoA dehydrogenase